MATPGEHISPAHHGTDASASTAQPRHGAAGIGSAPKDYATVFTNAKAGMDGVDKEKVKQVVYEMSKDSPHFHEEQRKQVQLAQ
jgi:hypothetical protein